MGTRSDLVWGKGEEAFWEHGRLVKETKFKGYGPSSEHGEPCFYDGEGGTWDVPDLIPLGSEGQLGDWTVTVTFEPKTKTSD